MTIQWPRQRCPHCGNTRKFEFEIIATTDVTFCAGGGADYDDLYVNRLPFNGVVMCMKCGKRGRWNKWQENAYPERIYIEDAVFDSALFEAVLAMTEHVLDTALSPDHTPDEIQSGDLILYYRGHDDIPPVAVISSYTRPDKDDVAAIGMDYLMEIGADLPDCPPHIIQVP